MELFSRLALWSGTWVGSRLDLNTNYTLVIKTYIVGNNKKVHLKEVVNKFSNALILIDCSEHPEIISVKRRLY